MRKQFLRHCTAAILCLAILLLSVCSANGTLQNEVETICASVVDIEKYGHAVLDILVSDFEAAGYTLGDVVRVRLGAEEFEMPYYNGYYTNPGELMLRGIMPENPVAVCINYGNLSETYGVGVGDTVEIGMVEKAGMLDELEVSYLHYTSERADYADDVTFANFRGVTTGRIAEGKLYRSASPVDNTYNRAAYANAMIEEAGVATVLNLADSHEIIEASFAEEGFDSAYYRALYEAGQVAPLNLAANFYTDDFAASMAQALTFLAENEPPYHIHCQEGKDRAGFTCMLLEALMGAELDEIIDDYMRSFYNYYGIDQETAPEKYQAILDKNLMFMLRYVTGVQDNSALAQTDLEAAITRYLLDAGMAQADIAALKEKLS